MRLFGKWLRRSRDSKPPPHHKENEAVAQKLINDFIAECKNIQQYWHIRIGRMECGRSILEASADVQLLVVLTAIQEYRVPRIKYLGDSHVNFALKTLINHLVRRKLPFSESDIEYILKCLCDKERYGLSVAGILNRVESFVESHGLTKPIESALRKLESRFSGWLQSKEERRVADRIGKILGKHESKPLRRTDAWAIAVLDELETAPPQERRALEQVLEHAKTALSSQPSQKWNRGVSDIIHVIGKDRFTEHLLRWFDKVGVAGKKSRWRGWLAQDDTLLDDRNTDILRGLVWACAQLDDPKLIHTLGETAVRCFKKIPGVGPRSLKIGNACLYTLSSISSMEAVAQLTRLRATAKHVSIRKSIEKAIAATAERRGLHPDEIEELAVPDYGIDHDGMKRSSLGEYVLEIAVVGSCKTQLRWVKSTGKAQKTVPVAIKRDHTDELKTLKSMAKDIEKTLIAQRDRLERLLSQEREWTYEVWRQRYLDHPLLATLARRLVWNFSEGDKHESGLWNNGRLIDPHGRPLPDPSDACRVRPWHPIQSEIETVKIWREHLEDRGIVQPFKQVHREVYVLTDAERNTRIYSNRFAAHILKQHQFAALCRERGWTYSLQGFFDSHNVPTLHLPRWNLFAEFWVEGIWDEQENQTQAGIMLYITTDQVRFIGEDRTEIPLEEVPPLVFSEVMRDIDLFVGVAGVGNDPAWQDGGPEGRYRDYWTGYAFGGLSETAKTRRDVLERLVPRLKIADRCHLTDRFLVVRGDLRTYKIHLGSSNILMEPNDQYLCIVPGLGMSKRPNERLYLPFEGDSRLSIILSKAFLLAEDTKIKDPTITSQINSR